MHHHQALGQISPSLCLYRVSVYGLFDFPLSLWLVYYVLQSCNGGGGLLYWALDSSEEIEMMRVRVEREKIFK